MIFRKTRVEFLSEIHANNCQMVSLFSGAQSSYISNSTSWQDFAVTINFIGPPDPRRDCGKNPMTQ